MTPSPSATFYSEVLAAGATGGAVLAATGSSPLPGLLAGGILVLVGGRPAPADGAAARS